MKALILAPFYATVLEGLRRSLEVVHESWLETRKLLSSEEFIERIQEQDIGIVVIEADFLPREV